MKTTLLVLGIGIVLVLIGVAYLALNKPKLVDKSNQTYTGKVSEYRGDKKLLVAFTASWASVWMLTNEELKKLDATKYDLLIFDEGIEADRQEIKRFGIDFLPTVALIESGKIIKKAQNLSDISQLTNW